MFIRNKSNAPTRSRNGLSCHLLLQENDVHGDQIAATWVDINPGSKQRLHRHVPEQVYVIVHGKGKMQVGQHQQEVGVGDLVYIPSNTLHGIENIADDTLTYISAATPAFNISALYDTGELKEGQSV